MKAVAAAFVGLALAAGGQLASAQDVGVSVSISQPGVYGRIDIGNRPPPPLYYPQPVIITQPRVVQQPIYMHVPPGHAKNWRKHCHRYDACGTPVYFVKSGAGHGGRRDHDHGHHGHHGHHDHDEHRGHHGHKHKHKHDH
ncbi:hypothetical protein OOT46_01275 [Aquabacterium sp. A7-Y]|uniref:hypothetical protein n=1 Tax=Aquabacterium sp. A7-Y TaxID=1349605 RepID=UPI00223DCBFE|nr:hypothetical protein [Aquabacterium sp. A7-Y]MCW7536487.1 hypothetical protein [Aquabacterium sp. A7-Y]